MVGRIELVSAQIISAIYHAHPAASPSRALLARSAIASHRDGDSVAPDVAAPDEAPSGRTGTLHVTVVRACNLYPKDLAGSSDPFVTLKLGKKTARSRCACRTAAHRRV